jgi:large subunit ribosomal protein L22
MHTFAKQRNIWMTPRKIRRVLDLIRGKQVLEAYGILRMTPFAASELVLKKLIEATANAQQKHGFTEDLLYVSQAYADEASRVTRFRPRAQGRIYKRQRRLSHLSVAVAHLATKGV